MAMNLFSIFDPATSFNYSAFNWASAGLGLLLLPYCYWVFPSRYSMGVKLVEGSLLQEVLALLAKPNAALVLAFIPMFFLVLANNSLGLLPYVFTATSHLVFTLALALPLWLAYFLFGWFKNTTHMLAHLVPQGTPIALMSFMVLIESVSGLIRPVTLAVRLAANMIAGHLLLALMSGAISIMSPVVFIFIVVGQVALVLLEAAVAVIQAYVFVVLSVLYANEV